MAKSIMIQGTMSNAGKSVLVGGLCRVLWQDGYRTAPFKSQNMALNSFVTKDGLEMGRAQVMQAEAAGIEPVAEMNPILLKPTNDTGSQVIVNGEVAGIMSASEYYKKKQEYIPAVMEAYRRLEEKYEIIVIEGAGSPAEINLKENDIVNMGLAKMVDAPVLLVGDIDRGGVFAQIVGTIELLEEEERRRIKGTVINKFRGDKDILRSGLEMLCERTGIPVCGVIPYFYLDIDDEDSLTERFEKRNSAGRIDIAVIRLPRISNFTDFAPLEGMEDVSLRYVSSAGEFGAPDAVILPGTKNTIADLLWLRQNGLEAKILRHSAGGRLLFGICGGYQMLGEVIEDPDGVERQGSVRGMGLLPMKTVFLPEKTRTRVRGHFQKVRGLLHELEQVEIEGYEIHMGVSKKQEPLSAGDEVCDNEALGTVGESLLMLTDDVTEGETKVDMKEDGIGTDHVYGCYVHGIFDRGKVVEVIVRALLRQKGYSDKHVKAVNISEYKEKQYDKLAKIIRKNIDMEAVYRIIGVERN